MTSSKVSSTLVISCCQATIKYPQRLIVDNNSGPSYLPHVAKKRPVGRPPLSSRERLSDALYVRMTPREREVLDKEARRRGVTASELVRELIRAADYGRWKA
jgi:hypothetical protein